MGLTWSGLYGFQNSYVLAVRKEAADTYGLETFSDLAAASENLISEEIRTIWREKTDIP